MAKTPPHHGEPWNNTYVNKLYELAGHNTPTPLMAYKLGRSEDAVRAKAAEIGLSLKPTNKPPYGTRKR